MRAEGIPPSFEIASYAKLDQRYNNDQRVNDPHNGPRDDAGPETHLGTYQVKFPQTAYRNVVRDVVIRMGHGRRSGRLSFGRNALMRCYQSVLPQMGLGITYMEEVVGERGSDGDSTGATGVSRHGRVDYAHEYDLSFCDGPLYAGTSDNESILSFANAGQFHDEWLFSRLCDRHVSVWPLKR